jgi:transcriptional repressor NrdR
VGSTRSLWVVVQILAYTAVEWFAIVLGNYFLFRAFSTFLRLGFTDAMIYTGFLAFGVIVHVPGIGGGMQVVSILVLTELFKLSLELASSLTLVLWAATFLLIVPFGLALAVGMGPPPPCGCGGLAVLCPFCGHLQDKVVDSRESKEGNAIRRRRQCLQCDKRFTTYERIDEVPYMVIKKDGRREKFDREKVLTGLLKACEKRPVSMARLSEIVDRVEAKVSDSTDREISTIDIGEELMEALKTLDKIAYVRFASVYRDFQDEQAFFNELRTLMNKKSL